MRNSDEQDKHRFFRAQTRYFRVENAWYYSTREGQEGPFKSREQAEDHLQRFLDLQTLKLNMEEKQAKVEKEPMRGDPSIWDKQIDII